MAKRDDPRKFRRVRVTGARRPGYIRGTGAAQEALLSVLRQLHSKLFDEWMSALTKVPNTALRRLLGAVNRVGVKWQGFLVDEARPTISALYTVGYKHGGMETGLGFDPMAADVNALEFLMATPDGIVPALQTFVEEERQFVEQVIRDSFAENTYFDRKILRDQLASRLSGERWRLNRIVRTETNKIAGLGRLNAWEGDPRRDWFHYHYIATRDRRTRPEHTQFMVRGPHTFDQVKSIWMDEREPFNCRCTLTRTLKPKARLVAEGHITTDEADDLF